MKRFTYLITAVVSIFGILAMSCCESKTYVVTFDSNGGIGAMPFQTFKADSAQMLNSNAFTRCDYTFLGWNTSSSGKGTAYIDKQNIIVSSDMTLYAQWKRTYTVSFVSNGGSGDMLPQTFYEGEIQKLSPNAFSRSGYKFYGWYTESLNGVEKDRQVYSDAQSIEINSDMILCAIWYSAEGDGSVSGHNYVDLGLPSGTLWATCNVGASVPEHYGNYYAWGEITNKDVYALNTYKYSDDSIPIKYTVRDCISTLKPIDDVASVLWGKEWRMPTAEDFRELKEYCVGMSSAVNMNGISGVLFTGPNGNSIFLPLSGLIADKEKEEHTTFGFYWSSSVNIDSTLLAYSLDFNPIIKYDIVELCSSCRVSSTYRYAGLTIRPVCKK